MKKLINVLELFWFMLWSKDRYYLIGRNDFLNDDCFDDLNQNLKFFRDEAATLTKVKDEALENCDKLLKEKRNLETQLAESATQLYRNKGLIKGFEEAVDAKSKQVSSLIRNEVARNKIVEDLNNTVSKISDDLNTRNIDYVTLDVQAKGLMKELEDQNTLVNELNQQLVTKDETIELLKKHFASKPAPKVKKKSN